jgi:hypothetical protein
MHNQRTARGMRQEGRNRTDEVAAGGRSPPHQSGGAGHERNAMTSGQSRPTSVRYRARRKSADPAVVVLGAALAAGLILPWAVIWLSDFFVFDTPDWLRWVVFAGPLALGLLATLIYAASRAWPRHSFRTCFAGRHGH